MKEISRTFHAAKSISDTARRNMEQAGETTIARMFHWEMGHRLPWHRGGCANPHGHSYRMWLEIGGICDGNGMLMDYGVMKSLVQPLLDELDHAFMCDSSDTVMSEFLRAHGFKTVEVDFHSTAENIALYLRERIWAVFERLPRIDSLKIRLQETDNSYAETACSRGGPA
jgi:6-pyruvoyltetrahydropterin/6-carboxytetrahydropterin synthase